MVLVKKKRDGFTFLETVASLFIVLAFLGLVSVGVQYAISNKNNQGLGDDRFGWFLGCQDLADYLHGKTLVGIEQNGELVRLLATDGDGTSREVNFYRSKTEKRYMVRAQVLGEGHVPIITGLKYIGKFSLINDRTLKLTVELPDPKTPGNPEGVTYETYLPIAGTAPARGHPADITRSGSPAP
ncbi:hypothetical protein [Schleiferilactobacillus shenzhenensis]|uniref:hypothetical protein n=1 Tax=Schleiferilactobacillus shenzhenensis TaxID=1231337 RepID=UPI00058EECD8|nr:hypothetical protein [Schleiferilactobacillus shenzhenensis]